MITVTNDVGRKFNVRLIQQGERYGRNGVLVHDEADPLVEWFDATYANDPGFFDVNSIGCGQFVSRYYLTTMLEHRPDFGLDLHGGEPVWKVSAENVRDALDYFAANFPDTFPPGAASERLIAVAAR